MRAPYRNENLQKMVRKSRKIDAQGAPGAVRASQHRSKIVSESARTRIGRASDEQCASDRALGREKCARKRPRGGQSASGRARPRQAPRHSVGNFIMDYLLAMAQPFCRQGPPLCAHVHPSIHQSINQSVSQSVNQSFIHSFIHSFV